MRRSLPFHTLLIALWLAPIQALAFEISGSDPQSKFTTSTGDLSTGGSGGHAGIVLPTEYFGGTIELDLQLDSTGPGGVIFGSTFTGNLVVLDAASNILLAADVDFLEMSTLITGAAPPGAFSGIVLGSIGPGASSSINVTVDNIGLSGPLGTLKVEFLEMTEDAAGTIDYFPAFSSPTVFDQDIFGKANIVIDVSTPEPSTGLLVAGALTALAAWRKRRGSAAA